MLHNKCVRLIFSNMFVLNLILSLVSFITIETKIHYLFIVENIFINAFSLLKNMCVCINEKLLKTFEYYD